MEQDLYISLIIKQLKGDSTSEEDLQLLEWLSADDDHELLKEKVIHDWVMSLEGKKDIEVDMAKDYKQLQARIDQEKQKSQPTKIVPIGKKRNSWLWAAASILLLGVLWWTLSPDIQPTEQVLATRLGEVRTLTLADNTKIWLNENSKLTYPEAFDGSLRMVKLSGEAYFDVAKNAVKPFIIEMDNASVKVLGTAFNLAASEEEVKVTLDEGRVQLSKRNGSGALVLNAGEAGSYILKSDDLQKARRYNRNDASWKSKSLIFQEVTLEEVLKDVEEYFGNKVQLEEAKLKECIFGGNFPKPDVNRVLSAIASAFEMQLSQDRNGNYLLKGGDCH